MQNKCAAAMAAFDAKCPWLLVILSMTTLPEIKLPPRVALVDRMDMLLGPFAAYATIDIRGGMTFRSHEQWRLRLPAIRTDATKLPINYASVDELRRFDGIGFILAEKIASKRLERPFTDENDLRQRVPGLRRSLGFEISF